MGTFDIAQAEGLITVVCRGEVTMEITPALKQALASALAQDGVFGLVMVMTDVTFLDSSGISVLIAATTKMRGRDGRVFLLAPSSQVVKTLEMVQLLPYFEVAPDRDTLARKLSA